MAQMPTWNGQSVNTDDIITVAQEAFDVLLAFMRGGSVHGYSAEELLHITEAASLVGYMSEYANATALPLARSRGASLADLSAATGLPRSTLQTKKYRDLFSEWGQDDE